MLRQRSSKEPSPARSSDVELDQVRGSFRESGALVRGQVVIRVLERLEAGEVEHDWILYRLSRSCRMAR